MQKSTLQLLRIPFSLFLLPVFLFALSQAPVVNWWKAALAFVILHFFIYPASNGYNSYMDRDDTPIGGLERPLQPTRQLYLFTLALDVAGTLLSLFVSIPFTLGIIIFIAVSKAYSYRRIRLKRYPVPGFLLVVLFQGISTFVIVYHGCSGLPVLQVPPMPAVAAGLLIGGFYPLTQIYQHEADKKDGVTTISYLLGYKGTFIFSGLLYVCAFIVLYRWFSAEGQLKNLMILYAFFVPVVIYFFVFAAKVWRHARAANFKNTMRMTWLAALSTNFAFLTLLTLKHLE